MLTMQVSFNTQNSLQKCHTSENFSHKKWLTSRHVALQDEQIQNTEQNYLIRSRKINLNTFLTFQTMRRVCWILLLASLACLQRRTFAAGGGIGDLPSQQPEVDEEDELDSCLRNNVPPRGDRTVVNLGYLTAVKGDLRNRYVGIPKV